MSEFIRKIDEIRKQRGLPPLSKDNYDGNDVVKEQKKEKKQKVDSDAHENK